MLSMFLVVACLRENRQPHESLSACTFPLPRLAWLHTQVEAIRTVWSERHFPRKLCQLRLLQAMYGDLRSWGRRQSEDIARLSFDTSAPFPATEPASASTATASEPTRQDSSRSSVDVPDSSSKQASIARNGIEPSWSSPSTSSQDATSAVTATAAAEMACLDVTLAVQFQVQRGEMALALGACKSNLLGFADLHPEGQKRLYVMYKHGQSYYDIEGMISLCTPHC